MIRRPTIKPSQSGDQDAASRLVLQEAIQTARTSIVRPTMMLPQRIRIGRGNSLYVAGTLTVYGSLAGENPTSVSAGMWNATTKVWIPANSTWDDGICYGYLDSGDVVAVAQQFNSITGSIATPGALVEGMLVYSASVTTYVLGSDTLYINLIDEF